MSGVISAAFYGMGAIYAQNLGYSVFQVSLFMGVTVIGGLLAQWPIGRLSDRFDRRTVMFWVLLAMVATCGGSLALAWTGNQSITSLLALIGVFGGTAATIYPLAVAHACDYVEQPQMLAASSGLLLSWALGSAVGPLLAAAIMGRFGDPALFAMLGVTGLLLALFVRYRMTRRVAKPADEQTNFVPVSPIVLAPTDFDPRADAPAGEVIAPDGDGSSRAPA
jgi:MFS family permease